jgi:Family of unknown function (DUF6520)
MGERKLMRKRITLLIAALMVALTMSFGSVAAFAANGFVTTTTNPKDKETSGNCNSKSQTCTVTNRGGQTVVGQSE